MVNKENTKIKAKKKARELAFYFDDVSDNLHYGLRIAAHEYKITMPKLIKIILTLYVDEGVVNGEGIKGYLNTKKANKAKKKTTPSKKVLFRKRKTYL